MNKEAIEQRIAQLEQNKKQLTADFNALEGAIQDCHFWLAELAKPAPETPQLCPSTSTSARNTGRSRS